MPSHNFAQRQKHGYAPSVNNRRRFQRLDAPVFARPAGLRERLADLLGSEHQPGRVVNISLGGLRLYSDDKCNVGDHLELEVFLPDRSSITVAARIVWVDALEAGQPAKFEVGAEFTRIDANAALRLKTLLRD